MDKYRVTVYIAVIEKRVFQCIERNSFCYSDCLFKVKFVQTVMFHDFSRANPLTFYVI